MKKELTNECFNEFDSLIGLTIVKCYRHFFDQDEPEPELMQQELDGDVWLTFNNGRSILFSPYTESTTLKYETDVRCEGYVDISDNYFWRDKTGQFVQKIDPILSEFHSEPYGIRFELTGSSYFDLLYVSESEYTFDALVIRGGVLQG